jgi:antitoxin component YwqK of YwqJK toxin-antitoxin module
MNTRNIFYLLIVLSLISCSKEKKVVDSAYPDGSPKKVYVYTGSGDAKTLLKETDFYPAKKVQMEGTYKNNKKDGKWVYYHTNGKVWSEGFFREGENDGKRTTYFENGKIRYEAWYNLGARVGKWKFYDEKGNLVKEVDYSSVSKPN